MSVPLSLLIRQSASLPWCQIGRFLTATAIEQSVDARLFVCSSQTGARSEGNYPVDDHAFRGFVRPRAAGHESEQGRSKVNE